MELILLKVGLSLFLFCFCSLLFTTLVLMSDLNKIKPACVAVTIFSLLLSAATFTTLGIIKVWQL